MWILKRVKVAAGSDYRWRVYENGFSEKHHSLSADDLRSFLELAQRYVEHSLRANRRPDALYHAYNLLRLEDNAAEIDRLQEMLEGQVAILSSELLNAEESLALLHSLRESALYRPDQRAYLLYPDKALPGFLQKNLIAPEEVQRLQLPALLIQHGETTLFTRDVNGQFHFGGGIRNAQDVRLALDELKDNPLYAALAQAESESILALFERVFHHAGFTGRSGAFFAYEGLGSVYWHMVAKLLLAAQETAQRFENDSCAPALRAAVADIRAGLGCHKSPAEYGAFPADPYSHTPKHSGARQPGMTGAVKEEILTRQAETGVTFVDGCLVFSPFLVAESEMLAAPQSFTYLDVSGEQQTLNLPSGSLTCFICQTPVTVQFGESDSIVIHYADETTRALSGRSLDEDNSRHIFARDGVIKSLKILMQKK